MNFTLSMFNAATSLAEQRDLFQLCFPETINTPTISCEHYQWKFHSFNSNFKSCEYAIFCDEGMRAYYAALPYRYKINGRFLLAAMVCDVMTHPDTRGKGLFTKIGSFATQKLAEQGFDFTTGYPVRKEVLPGHIKVGWEVVLKLPIYVKVINSNTIFKRMRLDFLSYFVNPFLKGYNLFLLGLNKNKNITTEVIGATDFLGKNSKKYDQFFEKWSALQSYCLVKDSEFLKWRLGAPTKNYLVILCYQNGELVSLAVMHITEIKGLKTLAILDFMTLLTDSKVLGAMHKTLINVAIDYGLDLIAIMQSKFISKSLKMNRYGYIRSPYLFKLIVKKLSDRFKDNTINYRQAHIMWIDSDDL